MVISAQMQRRIVLLLAAGSLSCAPAPREGESVHVADESAIIIWDAAAKTQHFIRRASFWTKAKDFGFLVPTPTIPRLEEADDGSFRLLGKVTAPEVVRRWVAEGTLLPAAAEPVTVIATAKVAGYDAAILKASDADALNRWLNEHGYASSPELVDWFKPYLERKWIISAFKVAGDEKGGEASTKAVRMSFQTDKPFFPYREPVARSGAASASLPRILRVYFLAESRHGGVVGESGAWPGKTMWSNRIDQDSRAQLLRLAKLPADTAPKAQWLTEFVDSSSPRSGTDEVYFSQGANQETVKRPDHVYYVHYSSTQFWGVAGIAVATIAGFLWLALALRRRFSSKLRDRNDARSR